MRPGTACLLGLVAISGLAAAGCGVISADDAPTEARAAATGDFHWTGRVASSRTVRVENINGGVTAAPSESGQVEIVAVKKKGRRGDPADVNVKLVETPSGVLVCTVYGPLSNRKRCDPATVKHNDTKVEYTVRVPTGVGFEADTVNGSVTARGLTGRVSVETVNGGIDLEGTGLAMAETVNGGIHVRLSRLEGSDPLHFETVNGGIILELPDDADADIDALTVNGRIQTELPVTGKLGKREVKARIGRGGRQIDLETVNGSIEIRRR